MTFRNSLLLGFGLLLSINVSLFAQGDSVNPPCVVCNHSVSDGVQPIQYKGRQVHVCTGKCQEHWLAEPDRHFAKMQSRSALFDEKSVNENPVNYGWLYFGFYMLAGMIFGGLCGFQALGKGLDPQFWFLIGLFFNVIAYVMISTTPKGDLSGLPAGVPAGFGKIPSTVLPIQCPHCDQKVHPSARYCSGCQVKLEPKIESETSRI